MKKTVTMEIYAASGMEMDTDGSMSLRGSVSFSVTVGISV